VNDVEVDFRDWLLAYMRAGIDGIVVTDHNTHEGIDRARTVRDELREEGNPDYRELAIFAGVEITVDGGFHLIGMFDVDTPAEVVNGLLHRCNYPGTRGLSSATTPLSFDEVVRLIQEVGGLPVPAHVDAPAGLLRHDSRNIQSLADGGRVLAVEVVDGADIESYGWVPVLGSDAHHLDASGAPAGTTAKYPGSHFTWIKTEQLSLRGVRIALIDGPSSVIPSDASADDPNDVSHQFVESMIVRQGETSTTYRFSPWLNAVIGGRGVGKSTLIELARVGLDRFAELPPALEKDLAWFAPTPPRGTDERFWDSDTEIELAYIKQRRRYRLTWKGSEPEAHTIERESSGVWEEEAGVVRDRFPALITSQKQIYEMAQKPSGLLRVIDEQPEVDMASWSTQHDELVRAYRARRAELAAVEAQIATADRVRGELADVDAELALFAQLHDSTEARELAALRALEAAQSNAERLAEEFEDNLASALQTVEGAEPVPPQTPAEEARSASLRRATKLVADAVGELARSRVEYREAHTEPSARQNRIAELEALLARLGSEMSNSPNDYASTVARRSALQEVLNNLADADERRRELAQQASTALEAVTNHRIELTSRRQRVLSHLQSDDIELRVFPMAEQADLETDLRRITRKATQFDGVFGPGGLLAVLTAEPRSPAYQAQIDQLKTLLRSLKADGRAVALPAGVTIDPRFFAHLETIDDIDFTTDVDLWFPEDRLQVRYRQDGDGAFRNLDQGSPGQKTAALLAVLLQLGDVPLIMDQPEDDLDNRLIYQLVVRTLRRIKIRRQVLVVTHNANIVVNGDAENVLVVKHGELPVLEAAGSIQRDDVKDSICQIMEGGETAFEQRYRRLLEPQP